MSAFDKAKAHARQGAADNLGQQTAAARERIKGMMAADTPGPQFLAADVVAAGALLSVHNKIAYAELLEYLRPRKVLELWKTEIRSAAKKVTAAETDPDEACYPLVTQWLDASGLRYVMRDGSTIYTEKYGPVRLAALKAAPPQALLTQLKTVHDGDYRARHAAFALCLSARWGELLGGEQPLRRADIAQTVAAMINHPVFAESSTLWDGRKRGLGSFLHYFAQLRVGTPARFGSKHVFGIIQDLDRDDFQIFIHHSLAGELSARDYAEAATLSPKAFREACREAGIVDEDGRRRFRTGAGLEQERWVPLKISFVESLDIQRDHSGPNDKSAETLAAKLNADQQRRPH